jgi:two-component system OmpR family response regulator
MRKLYARIFTDSGYSITMASTFSEASGFIAADHYDLLVTDLMFPDGLGTELIKLFEKKRAGARSLLVTGSSSAGGILKLAGIDDYFQKPFKVEDFLAAVVKRLAGPAPVDETAG